MDRTPTPPRAQARVLAALAAQGLTDVPIKEFSESTATAVDAASAIGTSVERIVKSLVFAAGDRPILVLASGPNRVDVHKLGALVGASVGRANASQVREWTGFAIGGVPPLGHDRPLRTVVDASLRRFDDVWCAAGTPRSVFNVETARLLEALPEADVREVA